MFGEFLSNSIMLFFLMWHITYNTAVLNIYFAHINLQTARNEIETFFLLRKSKRMRWDGFCGLTAEGRVLRITLKLFKFIVRLTLNLFKCQHVLWNSGTIELKNFAVLSLLNQKSSHSTFLWSSSKLSYWNVGIYSIWNSCSFCMSPRCSIRKFREDELTLQAEIF